MGFLGFTLYAPHAVERITQEGLTKANFEFGDKKQTRVGLWETRFQNIFLAKGPIHAYIDNLILNYNWPLIRQEKIDNAVISGASFSIQLDGPLKSWLNSESLNTIHEYAANIPTKQVFLEDSTLELWSGGHFILMDMKGWGGHKEDNIYQWTLSADNRDNKFHVSGSINEDDNFQSITTIIETQTLSTALSFLSGQRLPIHITKYIQEGKRTRLEATAHFQDGQLTEWVVLGKSKSPKVQIQQGTLHLPKVTTVLKGNATHWTQLWSHADKASFSLKNSELKIEKLNIEYSQAGAVLAELERVDWVRTLKNKKQTQLSIQGPIVVKNENIKSKSETGVQIALNDASASWPKMDLNLKGIKSDLLLKSALPLQGPHKQHVHFDLLQFGKLMLENGLLEIDLSKQNTVVIKRAAAFGIGGKVLCKGVIDIDTNTNAYLIFNFQGINIEDVAAFFPEFPLRARGKLNGTLAVKVENGVLSFEPGDFELATTEDATLEYSEGELLAEGIPQNSPQYKTYQIAGQAIQSLTLQKVNLKLFERESAPFHATIEGHGLVAEEEVPLELEIQFTAPSKRLKAWASKHDLALAL